MAGGGGDCVAWKPPRCSTTCSGPPDLPDTNRTPPRLAGSRGFAEITTDGLGSSVATIGDDDSAPLVAVVGHIDEIGLVVTHIDEKGFLYFEPIGGWDPQILVGQRVTVTGNRRTRCRGSPAASRSTCSTPTSARRS